MWKVYDNANDNGDNKDDGQRKIFDQKVQNYRKIVQNRKENLLFGSNMPRILMKYITFTLFTQNYLTLEKEVKWQYLVFLPYKYYIKNWFRLAQ